MKKFSLLFLFFPVFCFSQTKWFTGKVISDAQVPLLRANVIATPESNSEELKFVIANAQGLFKIELKETVSYQIKVSYVGYTEVILNLSANSQQNSHVFELPSTGAQLGEVVIKYDYKPIIIKKDTVTYDVKAFANGKEYKMKEVLEKLPGIEVDKDGIILHNGKQVNTLLVDGKLFFGGGSKLALENIPADALDKIEMIQDYNEIGFMKAVSNSNQLALNVKLKKDKKKFIFGDLEAGKGNSNFYESRAALFYYTPKYNVSSISDWNTVNRQSLSSADITRMQGSKNSLLTARVSISDLNFFSNTSNDYIEKKVQFQAFNFNTALSKNITIEGYALFSKNFTNALVQTKNTYLENDLTTLEDKNRSGRNNALVAMGNFKIKYELSNFQQLEYNAFIQASNNETTGFLKSIINGSETNFLTQLKSNDFEVKQYVEWHRKYNRKHTQSLVFDQTIQDKKPDGNWLTNDAFLQGVLPLEKAAFYDVRQVKKIKNNYLSGIFKDYWTFNNGSQFFTSVGNNWQQSTLFTNEKQLLPNGTVNDFATKGFGNDIQYQLNDFYIGLEYKFYLGKISNKPSIFNHFYNLKTEQQSTSFQYNPLLLELQWNSNYEIDDTETIEFNYKLSNTMPNVNQLVDNYILESYNTVFLGNALIRNEKFHSSSLSYRNFNIYNYFSLFTLLSYTKKINTIRNELEIAGIDQIIQPLQTNNPETSLFFIGKILKKIYKFQVEFNTNMSSFTYFQSVNGANNEMERKSQSLGLNIRTTSKKWPFFKIGYSKSYNQLESATFNSFQSSELVAELNYNFFKHFTFATDFTKIFTKDTFETPDFNLANASLSFQKINSPYRFEFKANNYLNNGFRAKNSFSDYLISNTTVYTLPRIFLFSFMYKI